MRFFSAFPKFNKGKRGFLQQNVSFDDTFSVPETVMPNDTVTDDAADNSMLGFTDKNIKNSDSAATAAYLKFVKSHDNRVSGIRKNKGEL